MAHKARNLLYFNRRTSSGCTPTSALPNSLPLLSTKKREGGMKNGWEEGQKKGPFLTYNCN